MDLFIAEKKNIVICTNKYEFNFDRLTNVYVLNINTSTHITYKQ